MTAPEIFGSYDRLMDEQRINYLLQRFSDDQLSTEEAEELLVLIREDENQFLSDRISSMSDMYSADDYHSGKWGDMPGKITAIDKPSKNGSNKPVISLRVFRWVAAAAIFIVISYSLWTIFSRQNLEPSVRSAKVRVQDIPPGGNKAVLTLGDGRKIVLDGKGNGALASQGNIRIVKKRDGCVQIEALKPQASGTDNSMLMVQTPRGGKYEIILPDGSRVWLNAESGIRFPSAFTGRVRMVEITGEAYFEVAKKYQIQNSPMKASNPERLPFIVKSGSQETEVLGTHFNINAYDDEGVIKTTLLEGSVRVTATSGERKNLWHQTKLLRPGQQSLIRFAGGSILVKEADTEEAVAWKNNLFRFSDTNLKTVMRQICRWYDVNVDYEGDIQEGHLTGYVSREVPVSRVLRMLEEISDLKFTIEGRKVTVRSK